MGKIKKDKLSKHKKCLNKLIKTLPNELIYKIRFMTYKIQKNILLRDIKNYVVINNYLRNMYYMRIIVIEDLKEPEDKNWLINDLYAFLNKNVPLMHGYIHEIYKFFKRKKNINTKKQVNKFINEMDKKNVSTQINVYLAMMNTFERIKLATYCLSLENC
jgi:hypothetical protein